MKMFKITYISREVGAIGSMQRSVMHLNAKNENNAKEIMFDTFDYTKRDHLMIEKIEQCSTY